jgi:glycosyltransferase involved in cell wall biosynthesis
VGRGYEDLAAEMRDPELEARVHFLSAVPPERLNTFIASADAAVIAYYAATVNELNVLPNGFFHSIAANLPLLYPPLPELHALGEQFELGIEVDMRDPLALASAIERLESDPDKRKRLTESVQRAAGELVWAKEEPHLRQLIAGLIGPPEVA